VAFEPFAMLLAEIEDADRDQLRERIAQRLETWIHEGLLGARDESGD